MESSDQNEKQMKMVGPTPMRSRVTYFHPHCGWKLKQTYLAYEVLMVCLIISLLPVPSETYMKAELTRLNHIELLLGVVVLI